MHGKQSHSSNFINLLECLHPQNHVSSLHRLLHTCLSQYVSKNIQFSQQKLFVLENLLPSFGKNIRLPSEANCWITLLNSHGPHPKLSVGRPSWAILRKSSVEIPFTNIFVFVSFHVMHSHLMLEAAPVHMECMMPIPKHLC